eukprot:gb/GECH01013562.1/.p1 GENE.gb/GECH01013562.1/~~gb/GECH01013562.1/.p1  ORF type:complete len:333 (+),score=89.89 gb/GECH01013562.1/:1-999(+)
MEDLKDFLKKFTRSTLREGMDASRVKYTTKDKVDTLVDKIIDYSYNKGIKDLVEIMEKDVMKTSLKEYGNKDIPNNKSKLTKDMFAAIEKKGLEAFLKKLTKKTLGIYAKILAFEEEDNNNLKVMRQAVMEETILVGARSFMEGYVAKSLKEMCKHLSLKQSGKKDLLIDRLLNVAFPGLTDESEEGGSEEEETKEEEEVQPAKMSRKEIERIRPELKKGIAYDDIFQYYWVDELRNFCKKEGVVSSGKKHVLIKRVIAYLEGDHENVKFAGQQKKKTSSTSKSSSKKSSSSSSSKKTSKKTETSGTKTRATRSSAASTTGPSTRTRSRGSS